MESKSIEEQLRELESIMKTLLETIIGLTNSDYKVSLNYSELRGIDIKIKPTSQKSFAKILGKKAKTIQAIRRLLEVWGTRNSLSIYLNLNYSQNVNQTQLV